MATYESGDATTEWEYKIVRSIMGTFGDPEKLSKLLDEESQSGWIMVEKFDDARVRFKRSRQARLNDSNLPSGVDPYRSYYGKKPRSIVVTLIGVVFGVWLLINLSVILFLVINGYL